MKRGTDLKFKFALLCARMRFDKWEAKGVLQSIWDFAAENAPRGDVGKFSDDEIYLGIGWPVEKRGRDLIPALVATHWLDPSDEHRLVIHDWHDHLEDWVKKRVQRAGLSFASENVVYTPHLSDTVRPMSDSVRLASDTSPTLSDSSLPSGSLPILSVPIQAPPQPAAPAAANGAAPPPAGEIPRAGSTSPHPEAEPAIGQRAMAHWAEQLWSRKRLKAPPLGRQAAALKAAAKQLGLERVCAAMDAFLSDAFFAEHFRVKSGGYTLVVFLALLEEADQRAQIGARLRVYEADREAREAETQAEIEAADLSTLPAFTTRTF